MLTADHRNLHGVAISMPFHFGVPIVVPIIAVSFLFLIFVFLLFKIKLKNNDNINISVPLHIRCCLQLFRLQNTSHAREEGKMFFHSDIITNCRIIWSIS